MGNCEEAKASKPEKSSSPVTDQTNVHVYPDWAAMQAYYGPRVAVPPYFNSAVANGHAPHPYMWGPPPQHMMPAYGAPYTAIYPHGGVYAHPGVPIAAAPVSNDSPAKSSGDSDKGLMKKLKGFDGLAMSLGNSNAEICEAGNDHGISQSGETEGSSEGSDGNTSMGRGQDGKKRSRKGSPYAAEVGKVEARSSQVSSNETNGGSKKAMDLVIAPAKVSGKLAGKAVSVSPTMDLELSNSPTANAKIAPIAAQQPCAMVIPNEALLQNERELKREKRKQSNRESARRSRLRKQAEAEELAVKVDSLTSENLTLKSEINRLTNDAEKLKLQNAELMEKLKGVQEEQIENSEKKGSLSTANLLSRVNNLGSVVSNDAGGDMYENNSNSGAKLRQLLDSSPRTDAVAAS